MVNAVLVQHLTKNYDGTEVLRGVDLKIEEGGFYALMGPNGSGKTTLTSIIASVRLPTSGIVEIYGKPPKRAKELIAYIPQENFSSTLLTGRENLIYFAGLLGYTGKEAKKMVNEILDKIELRNDADKRVSTYSGGMRKRLEIGTALFPSIKIFILDEPTTGVDPSGRRDFLGMLNDLRKDGITVLMTTHIGADAEAASKVGLMDKGRIIAEDEPDELKKKAGLRNVVNIETSIKSKKISDTLSNFNEGRMPLETETGYRVYSKKAEESTPEIVRTLDGLGCKVTKIEAVRPSLEDVFFKLTQKSPQSSELQWAR
ncbi:MAG: ATP-binding cassette domain-containing protein [Candidatus Bathyarchaeia archaeon]|jgi:ABC-2 type transport system ATP-binding protein